MARLKVLFEESHHPGVEFLRVDLADLGVPHPGNPPGILWQRRGGIQFLEIGQILIQFPMDEQDGARGDLPTQRSGSKRNRLTPKRREVNATASQPRKRAKEGGI